MHFAKDVEKLITGTEDLSLGPDENEFPALSVDHLSQVAADDHEDSQTSLGKGEAAEAIDDENMIEITGTHEQPTISTRDFSTTEYLPCMLHVHSPVGILPRYSSWSLVCLGSSSLYSHNAGIGSKVMTWFVQIANLNGILIASLGLSDQPGFLTGSGFLLPWDIPVRLQHNDSNSLEGRRTHSIGYAYPLIT